MRLSRLAVWAAAAAVMAAVVLPQQAVAAKKSPGLTMTRHSVTVTDTNYDVQIPCWTFHGSPTCGDVVVHVTVAGFAQYLGLDSMEALGNLSHPWWGEIQGTAQASGTAVCLATGVSYRFSQTVNLTPMWTDEPLSFLNTFTRISNDAATFKVEGGFYPYGSIPGSACLDESGVEYGPMRYTSAKVGSIVITWSSQRPEYPATATFTIRGKFPGPIA